MARNGQHSTSASGNKKTQESPPSFRWSTALNWLGSAFAIALLTTVASMWQSSNVRSAEDGERKALLKTTTQELVDSKADNRRLTEQKDQLQKDIDSLRKELLEEKSANLYNQKILRETESRVAKLDTEKNDLAVLAHKKDPCEAERQQIKDIEERLDVQPFWTHALKGAQREEAMVARDKKYEALNICLGQRQG